MLGESNTEPSQSVTASELEALHKANIASAQELLEIIEKMKVKQESWQVVVAAAMAKEREEEMECERAFKRVALHQMQTISGVGPDGKGGNNNFEAWLDSKGSSVGSSKIQTWYHDDILSRATPYCAMVPMPLNLSDEGVKSVVAEIDGLGLGDQFHVENFPFHQVPLIQSATALGILGKTAAQSQSALVTGNVPAEGAVDISTQYLQEVCVSGADVVALSGSSAVLKLALKSTPCLLLNDYGCAEGCSVALRRMGAASPPSPCALVRCILIRGDLVAVEGVPSTYNQKSEGKPFETAAFGESITAFTRSLTGPSSSLHERSVVLIMSAHYCTAEENSNPFSFYLLDVSVFEGTATDHFQLDELLLLAEYRATLRADQRVALSSATAGCQVVASKLLVRMAGSPWPDISAAISTVGRKKVTAACEEVPADDGKLADFVPTASPTDAPAASPNTPASGLSLSTVSLLMVASAAVATGATVALSALRKR